MLYGYYITKVKKALKSLQLGVKNENWISPTKKKLLSGAALQKSGGSIGEWMGVKNCFKDCLQQ